MSWVEMYIITFQGSYLPGRENILVDQLSYRYQAGSSPKDLGKDFSYVGYILGRWLKPASAKGFSYASLIPDPIP